MIFNALAIQSVKTLKTKKKKKTALKKKEQIFKTSFGLF